MFGLLGLEIFMIVIIFLFFMFLLVKFGVFGVGVMLGSNEFSCFMFSICILVY